ncbi:MAG: hypothetical protein ACRD4C_09910 [Candidatus Acidiferrales bacterium]
MHSGGEVSELPLPSDCAWKTKRISVHLFLFLSRPAHYRLHDISVNLEGGVLLIGLAALFLTVRGRSL